jgi:uncharacterized protein (TIGR03437 family)
VAKHYAYNRAGVAERTGCCDCNGHTGSLSPGTYSGSIVVSASGASPITVPVTLTVSGPTATMLISESAMTFTAISGGAAPLPHNFGILNTGACPNGATSCPMDWEASASTLVNGTLTTNGSWLVVSPSSGSVQRPFLDVDQPNVTVDPTSLSPGIYYGRILINSKAAVNNPQLITVTVNVLPSGFTLPPEIYPTGVIFTGVAGVNPSSTDVMVQNSATNPTSYQSSSVGAGFTFLPTNAAQPTGKGTDVKVYPDFSKLTSSSTVHGGITFLFADGTMENVGVLIVTAPPGVTPNSGGNADAEGRALTPHASGSCASQALQVVYRLLQNNFTAVVGQGTNIEAVVSDGCGNLVTNPQTAQVVASFNTATVNMSHIGSGVWQGTWTPSAAGTVAVQIKAILQSGAILAAGTSTSLIGTVTAMPASAPSGNAAAPLTSAVEHAASSAFGIPVAPGELITVYGQSLVDGALQTNAAPWPTQAQGLQVLFGVTPLPIYYSSATQMAVQVPFSVPLNTQYQLSVVNGTGLSVPQTVTIAPAVPGIFTVNQQGTGQGAIVHANSAVITDTTSPASIGETVTIYCTGLGIVSPAVVEGQQPTTASQTVNPVTATIGGVNAPVSYAGVTPGAPGLYQVNLMVPSGIATGDKVPVQITIAGQTSQANVWMSVH